jgi:CBS domain containing-hemolysin-like protein
LLHSKNALAEIHHGMPDGVEGLDDSLTNMMTGALMIGEAKIQEILTPIYKVTELYLDTKINSETIKKIEQIGFSRIPVAFSEENPVIVGILLVKSLIVIEHKGVTIGDLYRRAHL